MKKPQIVQRDPKKLTPYKNNARTHSEEQVASIASSVKEFGFRQPILIEEDGSILAGHGRRLAALHLGMKEVPCIIVDGLTDAQKKAFIIADNKTAADAGWDYELLKLEFDTLEEMGFDLNLTGFSDMELDVFSDDKVPEEGEPEEASSTSSPQEEKKIVLKYDEPDYSELKENADALVDKIGLEDLSALFKYLVEDYTVTNRDEATE